MTTATRSPGSAVSWSTLPSVMTGAAITLIAGHSSGIQPPPVGIVIGEQQSSEIRPPSFRIGPADHEGKPKPQQFYGFHEPGEVPSGLDNGLILDSLSRNQNGCFAAAASFIVTRQHAAGEH